MNFPNMFSYLKERFNVRCNSYYYYYEVSESKIDIIHSLFGSSSNLFVKSGSHKKQNKTVISV